MTLDEAIDLVIKKVQRLSPHAKVIVNANAEEGRDASLIVKLPLDRDKSREEDFEKKILALAEKIRKENKINLSVSFYIMTTEQQEILKYVYKNASKYPAGWLVENEIYYNEKLAKELFEKDGGKMNEKLISGKSKLSGVKKEIDRYLKKRQVPPHHQHKN